MRVSLSKKEIFIVKYGLYLSCHAQKQMRAIRLKKMYNLHIVEFFLFFMYNNKCKTKRPIWL